MRHISQEGFININSLQNKSKFKLHDIIYIMILKKIYMNLKHPVLKNDLKMLLHSFVPQSFNPIQNVELKASLPVFSL